MYIIVNIPKRPIHFKVFFQLWTSQFVIEQNRPEMSNQRSRSWTNSNRVCDTTVFVQPPLQKSVLSLLKYQSTLDVSSFTSLN